MIDVVDDDDGDGDFDDNDVDDDNDGDGDNDDNDVHDYNDGDYGDDDNNNCGLSGTPPLSNLWENYFDDCYCNDNIMAMIMVI